MVDLWTATLEKRGRDHEVSTFSKYRRTKYFLIKDLEERSWERFSSASARPNGADIRSTHIKHRCGLSIHEPAPSRTVSLNKANCDISIRDSVKYLPFYISSGAACSWNISSSVRGLRMAIVMFHVSTFIKAVLLSLRTAWYQVHITKVLNLINLIQM